VPKGFLPQQDTGLIVGVTDAAQDIRFRRWWRASARFRRHRPRRSRRRQRRLVRRAGTVNAAGNSGRLYINSSPSAIAIRSAESVIAACGAT